MTKATSGHIMPSARLSSRLDFFSSDIIRRLKAQPGTGLGRLYSVTLAAELAHLAGEARRLIDDGVTIPVPPGGTVLWDARP